jgi:hypothetical protein
MTVEEAVGADPTVLGGRYVLGELLGSGGMARVFRARDTVLGRDVAIKVFRQDGLLPHGEVRRGGEVRLLAALSHPGLVTVFDAGRDDSDPFAPFSYLTMELVEGTTLARVLDSGPLPPLRVASLGSQVAGALAYVHERGIVHRDIKPANLLMGGADASVAKLTDFGVARMVDSTRLTVDGTTLGTANYLSPEQATSSDVTPASDVYSLGLVLLECLTGSVAFPGHGVAAAVARLHRDPLIPSWLGDDWVALLTSMTARSPGGRPSAGEVAVRLAGFAAGAEPVETHRDPAVAAVAPMRRRRRLPTLIVALGTAAAIAVGVLIATGGGTEPVAAAATTRYPHVTGQLGRDLRTLESVAPQQLAPGVRTVARRSAVRDFHAAQQALSSVLDRLDRLRSEGSVDDAANARVATAIARVSSDLMRGQLSLDAAKSRAQARALARSAAAQAAAARQAAARRSAARQAAARRAAAADRSAAAAARAAAAATRARLAAAHEAAELRAAQQAELRASRQASAHPAHPKGPAGPGHKPGPAGPGHKPGPPGHPHPHPPHGPTKH